MYTCASSPTLASMAFSCSPPHHAIPFTLDECPFSSATASPGERTSRIVICPLLAWITASELASVGLYATRNRGEPRGRVPLAFEAVPEEDVEGPVDEPPEAPLADDDS